MALVLAGPLYLGSVPVVAEFIPVFIFPANLYAKAETIVIVVGRSFLIVLHWTVAADRTMAPVILILGPSHMPRSHTIAIALLRSPVAADLDVFSRSPLSVPKLLSSPGTALRLPRGKLG